jgi:predicted solute-binding protein
MHDWRFRRKSALDSLLGEVTCGQLLDVWPLEIGIPVSLGTVAITRPAAGDLKAKAIRKRGRKQ